MTTVGSFRESTDLQWDAEQLDRARKSMNKNIQ